MHLGIGAILQPAIRVGDGYAMINVRYGINRGRRCTTAGRARTGSVARK
jgi:hypothetical protein